LPTIERPQAPAAPVPDTLPARRVPFLYVAFAHACLFAAFALAAAYPGRLIGFFYHPRMLAVVHLVTLGWITSSILGSLYLVGPLTFRMPMPERATDLVAFACHALGVMAMAGHFWVDRPAGMALGACLTLAAIVHVALRALRGLPAAPVPGEAKLALALGLANALLAGALGLLIGIHKARPFLTGYVLDSVYAHAHLAAVGFATLTVVGAAFRMLPMMLPAALPRGALAWASPVLLEVGVLSLAAGLLWAPRLVAPAAVVVVAGLLAFLSRVVWMLRNPRPGPKERPRPDLGVAHALQAFAYLLLAAGLGLALALGRDAEWALRGAMAYGVFGLVGFLSQLVVGVEARLLPLVAWLHGYADSGFTSTPPSLHAAPSRGLQAAVLAAWTLGVPLLALGFYSDDAGSVRSAAALLAAAVVLAAANLARVVAVLRGRRR
jgi:hypothetical protein